MNHETFFENLELLADAPNGVQKLREMILSLAVQGKLVPQDSGGESAAVLLEKIAAEKNQSVKEKKIKRIRSLPRIDPQQIPYEIPYNWEWVRLGDVGHDCGQKKPDKKFTYIDVSAINKEQGIISDDVDILEPSEAPSRARKLVSKGSVIYATVRPYLLNIAIIDKQFEPEPIVSTAFAVLHPYSGILNKYLYYYLRSRPFITYVESEMIGMAYPAINDGKLYMGLVPIPPFEEQKRIAAKVDQLMALCDELEARQQKKHEQRILLNNAALDKLLAAPTPEEFAQYWQRICDNFDLLYDAAETVGQLRQAILQMAVQGKLVAQDPGDEPAAVLVEKIKVEKERLIKENRIKSIKPIPKIEPEELNFKVPDCYKIIRLGECIDLISGQHLGKNEQNDQGEGIPYLTGPADFGKVNPIAKRWTSQKKAISEKNDILITVKGAGVGKTNILGLEKAAIGRQLMAIRPIVVYQKYVYLMILASYDNFQSLSDGSTVPGIERKDILHFPLGLPPFEEQKRIVTKADQLMALCDELEAGLVQAQTDGVKLMEAVVHHVLAG